MLSSRARRIDDGAHVRRFDWLHVVGDIDLPVDLVYEASPLAVDESADPVPPPVMVPAPAASSAEVDAHLAALEREAFTKGYAAGERAGVQGAEVARGR